jgi:hypothetical protein
MRPPYALRQIKHRIVFLFFNAVPPAIKDYISARTFFGLMAMELGEQ